VRRVPVYAHLLARGVRQSPYQSEKIENPSSVGGAIMRGCVDLFEAHLSSKTTRLTVKTARATELEET